MGSLLGNYVHLHFTNYLEHGTYHIRDKKNKDNDPKIFKNYMDALQKQYQSSIIAFDKAKLKALENDYNNKRRDAYQTIKKVFNNPEQNKAPITKLLDRVIEAAKLQNILNSVDLINYIDFDEKTESISLNAAIQNILDKRVRLSSAEYQVKFSTIEGGFAVVEDLITKLKHESGSSYDPALEKRFNDLKKKYEAIINSQKAMDYLDQKYYKDGGQQRVLKSALPVNIGNYFLRQLRKMQGALKISSYFTALTAAFAEIMGQVVSKMDIEGIAEEEIIKILQNLTASAGLTQTTPTFLGKMTIKPDQKTLGEMFKSQKKNTPKSKIKEVVPGSGEFEINIDYPTEQKADVIISYDAYPEIGLSVKNTDMSQLFYTDRKGKQKIGSISVHSGTSLYVFLLGMAKLNYNSEYSNIHNHLLNVFAGNTAPKYLRKGAERVMLLSLLYSGLSGQGLGKESGFADLLVIEDKQNITGTDIPRVRFYNITTILDDFASNIEQNKRYLQYSPDFAKLKLTNRKAETALQRITKILLETRNINLTMAINKNYLNKLYNS